MSKTNKWLKLGATWLVLQLGLVMQALPADCGSSCCGNDWDSEFDIALGYRRDSIQTDVHSAGNTSGSFSSDKLDIKGLDLFILGLKARGGYCNWFARGYAYWGWGNDGEYREHNAFDNNFSSGASNSRNRIDINRYRTQDYSIGVGYLFDLCWCGGFDGLYIGPVVGWAYDRQQARLGKNHNFNTGSNSASGSVSNSTANNFLDDLQYTTKWNGPWLGIDFVYEYCEFIFDFGYEFHWAQWKANWSLSDDSSGSGSFNNNNFAFSDRRHGKNGHGNVVYADIKWALCDCWIVGLGFKYQDFEVKHGKVHNRGTSDDFSSSSSISFNDRVRKASWRAASIELDLGYSF